MRSDIVSPQPLPSFKWSSSVRLKSLPLVPFSIGDWFVYSTYTLLLSEVITTASAHNHSKTRLDVSLFLVLVIFLYIHCFHIFPFFSLTFSFPIIPKLVFFFSSIFNSNFGQNLFSIFYRESSCFYFSGSGFPLRYPTKCQRSLLDLNHPRHSSPPSSPPAPLTIKPSLPDHNNLPPSLTSAR